QPRLHGRPVDHAGLDLLLHPDLLQAGVRMVGADTVALENAVAVAVAADPTLAPTHAARRLGAAHHPTRAVHGREERLLGVGARNALENHRLVAHRAADEALLTRAGRSAALPDHPVGAAEVLLAPREVAVVVHLVH